MYIYMHTYIGVFKGTHRHIYIYMCVHVNKLICLYIYIYMLLNGKCTRFIGNRMFCCCPTDYHSISNALLVCIYIYIYKSYIYVPQTTLAFEGFLLVF